MDEVNKNTEQKILQAAEQIFLIGGYDGARMQEIADKAGINKAMLHYYFRSKDKLFERVFDEKIKDFFPKIEEQLESLPTFIEKLDMLLESYIGLMVKNPYIPFFVMNTVNKVESEEFIKKLPLGLMQKLFMGYQMAVAKKEIREVDIFQFMISILSMCAFPFVARPIMAYLNPRVKNDLENLMQERVAELKKYIRYILVPS